MSKLVSAFVAAAVACGFISRAIAQPPAPSNNPGNKLGVPAGPAHDVAQASNTFAFDLYAKLAANKKNAGQNLFFSPYSITTALDMVAEGARGETAIQMADTLRLPAAWRHAAPDANALPWDAASLHAGVQWLARRFAEQPVPPALTKQIDAVRIDLAAENEAIEKMTQQENVDWKACQTRVEKAQALVKKFESLVDQLPGYQLNTANAIWVEKTYPFEKAFIDSIQQNYASSVTPADFLHNAEGARKDVNDWIAKQTHDKIKDMLAAGSVPDITRLILVNAIYFKGNWAEPFKPERTEPADFTAPQGKIRVPTMNQSSKEASYAAFNADGSLFPSPAEVSRDTKESACYPDKNGFLAVELPYKGDGLAMTLFAPQSPDGLPALENKLTAQNLQNWLSNLTPRETQIALPKFTFKTSCNLNDTLKELGMPRAFEYPAAQFDGISASKELYIGLVQHDAFVDVNEKGTEAAAATVVMMAAGSAAPTRWPFVPHFRADRPFLFVIRDKVSGVILFVGRVMNPDSNR